MFLLVWQVLFTTCRTTGKSEYEFRETNDDYRLVWQDMFNNNVLDERNWTIEVNGSGGGNAELQYYRQENISIGQEPVSGESCLVITAKKENFKNKTATSGRMTSKDKVSFKFGKIEARIKLPQTANGLWPAFWMMGTDYSFSGWPACGEIDIMEMGNSTGITKGIQSRYLTSACHWGTNWNGGVYPNYAEDTIVPYSLQDDDFHLYTLKWDNTAIKMYLDLDKYPDNSPYYELDISEKTTSASAGNYFQKRFFILFNLAVGGNFTGIWDINQVTALAAGDVHMYVDYVKIYQKGKVDEELESAATNRTNVPASKTNPDKKIELQ
jgi:beta-glucanase (GH16 family)